MPQPGRQYTQAEFDGAAFEGDIVMKGGITSGVVYPLAVVELARRYRLRNIGGTSAGALAAAIAAAAEHGRANGGYLRIAAIPDQVAQQLLSFFQPTPRLRPLFNLLMAMLKGGGVIVRAARLLWAAIAGYPVAAVTGLLLGIAVAAGMTAVGAASFWVPAVTFGLLGLLIGLAWRVLRGVTRDLPSNHFGLCTGLNQPGYAAPALTEWLAATIDSVSGKSGGEPLTFGDLAGPDPKRPIVNLEMMTTNLSMRRPYRLPFREEVYKAYLFRRSDFERLFPARVVDYMIAHTAAFEIDGQASQDFYHFPEAQHLPVVVAARMSLSFPGLISAVPLYIRDFTLKDAKEKNQPRLCLFSDGGLSSNFPIHFFDQLLPNAPTFAIALEPYVEARHQGERVRMPRTSLSGILLPLYSIPSFGAFLMTLLDAAKDWQDNLQSTLPGYRERIVKVALKDDEGGLNLAMPPETIRTLVEFGAQAGETAVNQFDFDAHRWRRFLVAMARVEQTLEEFCQAYGERSGPDVSFRDFLMRYSVQPQTYEQKPQHRTEMLARADALAALGQAWQRMPHIRDGKIPRPQSDMRITPQQ